MSTSFNLFLPPISHERKVFVKNLEPILLKYSSIIYPVFRFLCLRQVLP